MLHRNPPASADISRRSRAQRRLRRAAAQRLFCSTNGCPTFLVPDSDGRSASCPICGLQRRVRPERTRSRAHRSH